MRLYRIHCVPFTWTSKKNDDRTTILFIVFAFLVCQNSFTEAADKAFQPFVKTESQSSLFEISNEVRVTSPTHFPKPTLMINETAVPIVEPVIGHHRTDQDAILAYAEGYKLPFYMMFLETLTDTGYKGDVVFAIADERIIRKDVKEYLQYFAQKHEKEGPNLVVYQYPLDCDPRDGSTENIRQVTKSGDTDVFQMCRFTNIYGWKDEKTGKVLEKAPDPREGRVVATLRYEWYWIWSMQYQPHSWIMLLDARDSFFQLNPFADVPRTTDPDVKDGLLYLFGENADATRLGKSKKNLKWIRNGYGEATLEALKDKPTICSGSTMGEQIAIETYLRAMVNEHDECDIKMTGSDQGFHNYLYYSGKLTNADPIRKIVVWEQGRGIINNLGALRTRTLEEWGIHDESTHKVYQWDGKSLSPVCHQFDRDKSLHAWMVGQRHKQWQMEWDRIKESAPKYKKK